MTFRPAALLAVLAISSLFAPGRAEAQQNPNVTVFASATRVGSGTAYCSSDVQSVNWKGMKLFLNITAEAGTATLDLKLQGKDILSGSYYDIPSAALDQKTADTGDDSLTVYSGIAETANETISDVLPRVWRACATIGATGADSFTFSVGATLLQ